MELYHNSRATEYRSPYGAVPVGTALRLRLDVKIIQISHPAWERNFYLVSNDREYQPPAVRSFRQFILDGAYL